MRAPHDDPAHARVPGFEHDEIADAAFVEESGVVDDEHVAGGRAVEGFEEYVDAAEVPCWQHATLRAHAALERGETGRRDARRHAEANTGIDHRRGGPGRGHHACTVL